MISDALDRYGIKSKAKYVEHGYGQVEPNHLSAQRTGQIFAQLPAAADIPVLENGQFVKYDYKNGVVNFSADAPGEWMLVYNEIKLYREHQLDCEFAMVKDNYNARVYSPLDADTLNWNKQSRHYNGVDGADGTVNFGRDADGEAPFVATAIPFERLTAKPDMYELHYNEDPFHIESHTSAKMMPEGTKMVPRVFKTNIGDIYTTNCIDEETLELGDCLEPAADTGYLKKTADKDSAKMLWQVVKIYTMPDRQKGVKLMRVV